MTAQKLQSIETVSPDFPTLCVVTAKHISEMYDRFESGLCDQSTCNAVALSLSEHMSRPVRVFRRHGVALLELPNRRISNLPEQVRAWLEEVDKGFPPKPFCFELSFQEVLDLPGN